jgi:diguanylate cyclase (GGDEF)-like protein/PAS domain S-box-containing protein
LVGLLMMAVYLLLSPSLTAWIQCGGLALASLGLVALTMIRHRRRAGREGQQLPDAPYKELIDQSNDGVIICDASTYELLYTNLALQTRLGYDQDEILALALGDVFAVDKAELEVMNARFRGTLSQFALNMQHRCNNGDLIEVEVRRASLKMEGRTVLAFVTRDVSVARKAEQQLLDNQQRLARIAHHDQLTELPNRHYLAALLPEALLSARAHGLMLGIVFLDLDRFKHINDTFGHETGDQLLGVVASRLRQCVRESDVIIRMGGDEFVIVCLNLHSDDEVTSAAGRIINALAEPIVLSNRVLQTSASVGISLFPRDGENMAELLKHADAAMYQAKDRGRNNVQIFSEAMNKRLKHRVAVEVMLREALRLKQLDVYYQPIVNLSTRKTIGLEALIRWHHPVHGMIPADWFIPVAEETGLVIPIGNYVLHRALQDMSHWRKAGNTLVPVSLNIAPSQLLNGEFQSKIRTLLNTHDLPPELLQLEMTERGVFDSRSPQVGERREDTLASLRDLGIKIAIDDFGTGYSSLAYLKHWRVDMLKIDKSFVRDIVTDASDLAIVSAIIAIARNLHIEVIAEGIEGYQQAEILQSLGCHHGQGFLFSRPMPAARCPAMLKQTDVGGGDYENLVGDFALSE